jgi:hypothetical protein
MHASLVGPVIVRCGAVTVTLFSWIEAGFGAQSYEGQEAHDAKLPTVISPSLVSHVA